MWIQANHSFRFQRPIEDPDKALEDMANQQLDTGVLIENGQTKELPEWVRDNWMFDKAIEEGLLVEIVMPKSRKKKLAGGPKQQQLHAPKQEPETGVDPDADPDDDSHIPTAIPTDQTEPEKHGE